MVTRLIEGKDALDISNISLPAAVIIPLRLIQYHKHGYIWVSPEPRSKAQIKLEEDEYKELSDTYNTAKAAYMIVRILQLPVLLKKSKHTGTGCHLKPK